MVGLLRAAAIDAQLKHIIIASDTKTSNFRIMTAKWTNPTNLFTSYKNQCQVAIKRVFWENRSTKIALSPFQVVWQYCMYMNLEVCEHSWLRDNKPTKHRGNKLFCIRIPRNKCLWTTFCYVWIIWQYVNFKKILVCSERFPTRGFLKGILSRRNVPAWRIQSGPGAWAFRGDVWRIDGGCWSMLWANSVTRSCNFNGRVQITNKSDRVDNFCSPQRKLWWT